MDGYKLYRSNRKLAEVIVGSSCMEFKVPTDDETIEPLRIDPIL
jgi:hypothetical protein